MLESPSQRFSKISVGIVVASLVMSFGTAVPVSAEEPDAESEVELADLPKPSDSDDDGVLDAPDTQSAMAGALTLGEHVEDLSQRTGSVLVVANPDGTFTRTDAGIRYEFSEAMSGLTSTTRWRSNPTGRGVPLPRQST